MLSVDSSGLTTKDSKKAHFIIITVQEEHWLFFTKINQ